MFSAQCQLSNQRLALLERKIYFPGVCVICIPSATFLSTQLCHYPHPGHPKRKRKIKKGKEQRIDEGSSKGRMQKSNCIQAPRLVPLLGLFKLTKLKHFSNQRKGTQSRHQYQWRVRLNLGFKKKSRSFRTDGNMLWIYSS